MFARWDPPSAVAPPHGATTATLLLCAALLGVGVFLRLTQVEDGALTGDEIYTLWTARAAIAEPGSLKAEELWHERWAWITQPLSQLATTGAFALFGVSPFTARLFPLLAGLLALLVLPWWIGRLYGTRAGLCALALLALSPRHVMESQFARYESACFLFGGLTLLAALTSLRSGRRRDRILAAGFGVLAVGAHLMAALPVLVILGTPLLVRARLQRRAALVPVLVVAGLLAGWVLRHEILGVLRDGFPTDPVRMPAWRLAASEVYNLGLLPCALAAAFVVGAVRRPQLEAAVPVLAWLAPAGLLGAVSAFKAVGPRFLSAAEPALLLLAVLGIARWADRRPSHAGVRSALAVALVGLSQLPLLISDARDGQRYDFRRLGEQLVAITRPDDLLLCDETGIVEFYVGKPTRPLPDDVDKLNDVVRAAAPQRVFLSIRRQRGELVHAQPAQLQAWLDTHGEWLATFGRRRLDDVLYRFEVQLFRVSGDRP